MTKPSFTADAELINPPRAANVVWKNARSEILSRALRIMGPEARARDGGEGFKPTEGRQKLPSDSLSAFGGEEARNLPLAIVCASLEKDSAAGKELPPWESLLRLILTADAVNFSCSWLESEDALAEFLNSGDADALERCGAAQELLYAAKIVNSFINNSLPAFYQAINASAGSVAAPVNDLEGYGELRVRLRKAAAETGKLQRAARALRKTLAQGRAGVILQNIAEDIFKGGVLDFLKILRSRQEEIAEVLKEAADAILPRLFDGQAARLILESSRPPISSADMALLLEEIQEIEARLLKPDVSQLAGNILPALLGEKAFDIEAFDTASDSGLAKPLSHRLIRGLEKGAHRADAPPAQVGESAPAPSAPAEAAISHTAPLVAEPVGPTSRPQEPGAGQVLSTPAPALEPADGFDLFENEFSAPPQPGEFSENPGPETMTIEQACAISELEREREEKEKRGGLDENSVQTGGDFAAVKLDGLFAEALGIERPNSAAEENGAVKAKGAGAPENSSNEDLDKNGLSPASPKPAGANASQNAPLQLDFAALAASSLPGLDGTRGGLYWLSGDSALGLEQTASILEKLVERENRSNPGAGLKLKKLNGKNEAELFQSLLDEYDSQEGGQVYFLQAWEASGAGKFMRAAGQWLEQRPAGGKLVKIICVLDPAALYDFIASGQAEKAGARHFQLKPWTRGDLEPYFNENGRAGAELEEIMRQSGGWPKLAASLMAGRGGSLASSDFLGGAGPAPVELTRFIANEMGGKLDKDGLKEEASVMLEMFPKGILSGAEDMLNWIQTLRSLSILRAGDQYLELDPIARGVILTDAGDA